VITGGGELALRIAEALMLDHDVVVVVPESEDMARMEGLDVQLMVGNAGSLRTLEQAGTQETDVFIAAAPHDERNIVACIAAHRLGAKNRICIMNTASDLHAHALDDVTLASSAGVDAVYHPAEQLAEEIVDIVTVHGALDMRSFFNGRVGLLKAAVGDKAPILQHRLVDTKLPAGVRLVMVHRGEEYFIPGGSTKLEVGDHVTAIGRRRALLKYGAKMLRAKGAKSKSRRRAIIAGGGGVGIAVARSLRERGWDVKIIEQDRARCELLANELDCLVLHGDGADLELLQEEHAESASALIAVTNNDEKNLLISLLAKQLGVERIITRADKPANERLFDKVGIDVVLSATQATVRSIVREVVDVDQTHIADLEHGELAVLDFELPPNFPETALALCKPHTVATVGAILRGSTTIIPKDDEVILPGDHVLVVSKTEDEEATMKYFKSKKKE